MLGIDDETLRIGLGRADDLFRLHRLSGYADAEALAVAVFENFGFDADRRARLATALAGMLPIEGDPLTEAVMVGSLFSGVLVGLLIAEAALTPGASSVPDFPPLDL